MVSRDLVADLAQARRRIPAEVWRKLSLILPPMRDPAISIQRAARSSSIATRLDSFADVPQCASAAWVEIAQRWLLSTIWSGQAR